MPAAGRTARRARARTRPCSCTGCWAGARSDALYRAVPYWGLAAGDVLGYLNRLRVRLPRRLGRHHLERVGPRVRALRRAHRRHRRLRHRARAALRPRALRHGVSRTPLVPDWGADRPVDLVGPQLRRRDGAAAGAAARARLPGGGAGGRGRGRGALAAVHRRQGRLGARAGRHRRAARRVRRFSTCSRMLRMRSRRCFSARRARSASRHSRTYTTSGSTSSASAATRTSRSRRPRCGCWRKTRSRRATTPLTTCVCAGARALNASIDTLPDAWYFSIPCCRTLPRLLTHDQKPDTAMTPLLWPFSTAMGRAGGAVPSRLAAERRACQHRLRPLSRRRTAHGLRARSDAAARRVAGTAGRGAGPSGRDRRRDEHRRRAHTDVLPPGHGAARRGRRGRRQLLIPARDRAYDTAKCTR